MSGEKALPEIPMDTDEDQITEHLLIPCSDSPSCAHTNKVLPSINVENTLSEEEMSRLHELWNEAGLSARAHRRRQRTHRIPAPISILEPEEIPSTIHPSFGSTPTRTTGTRKRWGFLTARPFSEKKEVEEKKSTNALERLRGMAQDRLKKKVRYARSAPNLGDQVTVAPLRVIKRGVPPRPIEVVPTTASVSSLARSDELVMPEVVLQPEHGDKNAIYFAIDPSWRASQDSMQFHFITPVPDSPTCLERPDSPLEHRHHSLDQLSFSARNTWTATEFPVGYPSDQVLHPIDELHAHLEL